MPLATPCSTFRVSRRYIPAVVALAAGLAAGYYRPGGPSAVFWTTVVLAAVGITIVPFAAADAGRVRPAPLLCAAGLLLGFLGGVSAVTPTRFALPRDTIAELSGRVKWDSTRRGTAAVYAVELSACSSERIRASASGAITVIATGGPQAAWGSTVVATGVTRGAGGTWFADGAVVNPPESAGLRGRAAFRASVIPPDRGRTPGAALFLALTTGVRDDLDPELAELFRRSGCSHVLALSGMHLGILCAVPLWLLRRRIGPRKAAVAAAAFAVLYVFFVGPKPSLIRATVMYGVSAWLFVRDVRLDSVSILSAAFAILLFVVPEMGRELSFQLSFLALAGVFAVAPPGARFLSRWLPPAIASGVSAAVGAQLMTAGLVLTTFGTIYPVGLVASLVLVPLVIMHLGAGLIAFLLPIVQELSHDLIVEVARFFSQAPSLSISAPAVLWALGLLPTALWLGAAIRSRR